MSDVNSFTCAPVQSGWIVVGALDRIDDSLLITGIDATELFERLGVETGQGEVVLRSGRRLVFEEISIHEGRVAVRVKAQSVQLRGGRIELLIDVSG